MFSFIAKLVISSVVSAVTFFVGKHVSPEAGIAAGGLAGTLVNHVFHKMEPPMPDALK